MGLKKCHECGNKVSTEAAACPACGAPVKVEEQKPQSKRTSRTGCLLLGVGAIFVLTCVGIFSVDEPRSEPPSSRPSSAAEPAAEQPDRPADAIVRALAAAGFEDGLGGRGWHRSRLDDGTWVAILRKTFGPNEVSCLLESSSSDTLDYVELEAELYEPGVLEEEVTANFSEAVAIVYPDAPDDLVEAIELEREWSDGSWRLTRELYRNGGYGVKLRKENDER
jgi:hypothetical protein